MVLDISHPPSVVLGAMKNPRPLSKSRVTGGRLNSRFVVLFLYTNFMARYIRERTSYLRWFSYALIFQPAFTVTTCLFQKRQIGHSKKFSCVIAYSFSECNSAAFWSSRRRYAPILNSSSAVESAAISWSCVRSALSKLQEFGKKSWQVFQFIIKSNQWKRQSCRKTAAQSYRA